ncbi:HlyD family efflux transporter periplasmic adaptor subunit [Paraflavitalea soli]|uniref:HlyD family efflux transporter periplasmic adaptor subunit n=1 Tax=Paraflavitalea soli TaxID=2315862 RepID=A0A3B7MT77_9BACT|nr:HlyD family efflux transporter periplasmic adaptor subunit [Paraflavitalea soli]AXY76176.1 HlyD family efflux transporter periplasmic adaptor subunit [Paraflavitalea soli]
MNTYLQSDIHSIAAQSKLRSFSNIYLFYRSSRMKKWLWGMFILLVAVLFLPWTQNIRARGTVTTLRQEQRPQQVNTLIAGSIVKWHIKEGDLVKAGDTLLQLGEVKVEYFDPQLLKRTQEQITAKQQTMESYRNKAAATTTQSRALEQARELKLQSLDNKIAQQQLKIKTEEADLAAAANELEAYKRQIEAARIMLDSGAISLIDFEKRKINYQNGFAKWNSAGNKLEQSKQEMTNLRIEQQATLQDYADKIAKVSGDRFSSLSDAASTEAELLKLQNQLANYDARSKLYYIIAPQSGQITKARKAGIGEFIKEGDMIVEIVPDKIQYAIELFVKPMDLPLVNKEQKVRFVFDGFPAIVFSGWPGGSYGTFGGKVVAVENSVSANGKFRILVVEDSSDRKWPAQLRIGGGAEGIMLLKDVPVYYELWRNINGFPPEYYQAETTVPKEKKL